MPRRITWLNEKGGSGKSTNALNLSANLASRHGKQVLLVDVDHQANITAALTGKTRPNATLTQVLMRGLAAKHAVIATSYGGLDLLPADASLSELNVALADTGGQLGIGRESRLRRALEVIENEYDFVVVDTGPQRTLLNVNVLNYVDEVFVPVDPGYWSLLGVTQLDELIDQVRTHMQRETLNISGIVLTKTQRTNVARDVEQAVRESFGASVFRTSIPLSVKVEEAHSRGLAVADHAPDSAGAQAYLALTEEILSHDR